MIKASIQRGAGFYLERKLFEEGGPKYRPWFRLHYPVHYYYDILVGLDVITALGFGGDKRLTPALEILSRKTVMAGGHLKESTPTRLATLGASTTDVRGRIPLRWRKSGAQASG